MTKEDDIFRIESILREEKREKHMFPLEKWKGYPEKFSSWVKEKDVKNL